MVDDREVLTDQIDDASTGPQAGAIAGGFWPRDHHARQATALRGTELGRSTGSRPGAQAGAPLSSMCPLPSPDGAPIDADAVSHDMNRDITLQQCDRAESSSLELSRASLWAHAVPPTGKHNLLGHYLHSNH